MPTVPTSCRSPLYAMITDQLVDDLCSVGKAAIQSGYSQHPDHLNVPPSVSCRFDMVLSPSEDETPKPPKPLLSTLPGITASGVKVDSDMIDFDLRPNTESTATSTKASTRRNSLLHKLRMFSLHSFSVVGVLISLSVLAAKTDLQWSLAERHGHHSSRDINPRRSSGNITRSLQAHDGHGPEGTLGVSPLHEQVNKERVEIHRSESFDHGLHSVYSTPFRFRTTRPTGRPPLCACGGL